MLTRAPTLAAAVYEKEECLDDCIGFLDGKVLNVEGHCSNATQIVVYNGHKRKHTLKFQALTGPDVISTMFWDVWKELDMGGLYTPVPGWKNFFQVHCMREEGNFEYIEIQDTIDAFTLKFYLKGKPHPLKDILTNL